LRQPNTKRREGGGSFLPSFYLLGERGDALLLLLVMREVPGIARLHLGREGEREGGREGREGVFKNNNRMKRLG